MTATEEGTARVRRRNVKRANRLVHAAIDTDQVILAEIELIRQTVPPGSELEQGLGRMEQNAIKNSELLRRANKEF